MLIKSKQPGVTVKRSEPQFEYTFEDIPIEVKIEHAKYILQNATFEEVKSKKKKGDDK